MRERLPADISHVLAPLDDIPSPKFRAAFPARKDWDQRWTQSLLGAIAHGVLVIDDAGLICWANQHAESLFGWEHNSLVGQSADVVLPPTLIHADRADYMQRPARKLTATGHKLVGQRKDGTTIDIEVNLSSYDIGAAVQVVGLITPISPQVAAETRVEDGHETRFEPLFRAFPVPTYVWQRQGDSFVLIDYNDAALIDTSAAVREYLHRGRRVRYPEGGEIVADMEQCYREKTRFTHETPGFQPRSDVEIKDLIVTYVWIEPDLVLTIIDDVTTERTAYSNLKQLSSAVEQTGDAVFITDRTGVIEYVNPAFERITGFMRAEALGNNPRILKSGQMAPEYYEHLWHTVLGGEDFRAQTLNRRRDGTLFVAEQTITPMKDHAGQITHLVSVLKDMTDRIHLIEQETEHRLAGTVQKHLFPIRAPEIAGYDIAGAVFPAQATSGDYFDFVSMANDTLGIVVADVSGHGMGAALIMAEARAYLRSITRYESDPRTVLRELNHQIQMDLADGNFITTFLARLDPVHHLLQCANAGGWPAYIVDHQGQLLSEIRTDGLPVGVYPDLVLRPSEAIALTPGSIVILATDGIPEAHDADYREFGVQAMLSTVHQHRMASAHEIIDRVRDAVLKFSGPAEQFDDQTLVICKRLG